MALTQQQLSLQMIAQLRRLDPSVSAEVGTPERKILDTVAQGLADSQIDLAALQQALDIDAKFGDGLDRFLALFGFPRQKATYATGFVTFSRTAPATADITIPANTQLQVPPAAGLSPEDQIAFYTTTAVILASGTSGVVAPIRARVAGQSGNVAANLVTQMIGTLVPGITGITNEVATRGGINRESDDEYKVRFKNTVFRNLAGTRDQYLALAVSTQYSVKANVIGTQSLWREYVQVPPVDDASSYDINDDGLLESGNGTVGHYTTALSIIPYAKALWTTLPVFASNGRQDAATWFYRSDVDFKMNTLNLDRNVGDAYRLLNDITGNPSAPNFTFLNVYTGVNPSLQVVRPGDLVLVEFSYMSEASRNDLARNVTNAVDVFVDGGNDQFATTVLTAPTNISIFVDDPTSKYHFENYRRFGEPNHRPLKGNYLMPLMWEPITDLPASIIVGDNTYLKNTHYWLVEDISELSGSVRARNGIEWSQTVKGNSAGTPRFITEWIGVNFQPIEVENYTFDRNIMDLQTALEASKQVTTDVLAHKALVRYFKFDITVMYMPGALPAVVNGQIRTAVDTYLKGQYFGTVVQLSDILNIIHDIDGVDNVRWSSDIPATQDKARAYECDAFGKPLLNVDTEHIILGTASTPARQLLTVSGMPTIVSGSPSYFYVKYGGITNSVNAVDPNSATFNADLDTALEAIAGLGTVSVTTEVRATTGVKDPQRSYIIQWAANGAKELIQIVPHLKGGPKIVYNDFVLRDSELPALPISAYTSDYYNNSNNLLPVDTVPGFIIRARAQNTWIRS